MRMFVNKVFAFFLLSVVVLSGLEVVLRKLPNVYKYKWNFAVQHADELETVVLGSSHAYFGIDTDIIKPLTLNAANVAQTLECDNLFLSYHLENLPRLKRVIMTISYFSLFCRLTSGPEMWRESYYRLYWHAAGFLPLEYNFELGNPFPGSRIIGFLKGNDNLRCSNTGMGLDYCLARRAKDWQRTGAISAKRHTMVENRGIFEENIMLLKVMVAMCREKNVDVFIVTLPAWTTYTENLDPEQLQMTIDGCQEIEKQFDCHYYNFLKDTSFCADDFFDADHLNELGARKMAKKLLALF